MFGLKIQSPVGWGQTEFHYINLYYVFTMYHTCMFPWDARFRSFVGPFQKERKAQSFSRQQLIIYIYSNTSTKNLPLTARDLGIEVKDKTTLSIINQVCTKSFEALQQLLQKSQLLPSRPAILSLQTKYLGQTAAWRSKQKNNSKLCYAKSQERFAILINFESISEGPCMRKPNLPNLSQPIRISYESTHEESLGVQHSLTQTICKPTFLTPTTCGSPRKSRHLANLGLKFWASAKGFGI